MPRRPAGGNGDGGGICRLPHRRLFRIAITASMARGRLPSATSASSIERLVRKRLPAPARGRGGLRRVRRSGSAGTGRRPSSSRPALGSVRAVAGVTRSRQVSRRSVVTAANGLSRSRNETLEAVLTEHEIPISTTGAGGDGAPGCFGAPSSSSKASMETNFVRLSLSGGLCSWLHLAPDAHPRGPTPRSRNASLVAHDQSADGDRDENQVKPQAHGLRNVLIQDEVMWRRRVAGSSALGQCRRPHRCV